MANAVAPAVEDIPAPSRGRALIGGAALAAGVVLIGHLIIGGDTVHSKRLPSSDPELPSLELTAQRAIIPVEWVSSLEFDDPEAEHVVPDFGLLAERGDYVADGPDDEAMAFAFAGEGTIDEGRPTASGFEEEEEDEPPQAAGAGLRDAPAHASEAAASALAAIPVGKNDMPPVAGVGQSGIHIDRIATGTGYEGHACTGEASSFSVGDRPTISLCFRVVHPRGDGQAVLVLWERDGEVTRRISVSIPDRRTYRTRAYFRPGTVDVGRWTARVLAPDHTVIATVEFDVVP